MEIDFLILADYAESVNNKLYMMGGAWNQIAAPMFPMNLKMAFVVGINFEENELPARIPLQISMRDVQADRPAIPDILAEIAVQLAEPTNVKPRSLLAINTQFPLPGAGYYSVVASAGPNVRRETFFEARLVSTLQ
jgi:hypothetical protein